MPASKHPTFQIRRAGISDVPDLVRLIHACFAEQRSLVPPSSADRENVGDLSARLAHGAAFLVVVGGTRVGCVVGQRHPDCLYIGRLAVLPTWRRQGVAQMLLRAMEDHARETGETLLELNVRLVLDGNIRLFEGAGFQIVAQRSHPGFAMPTFHVMQKRLD
nr:GNAT family N-acetyltransferase [uncultured Dongia sp.]